MRPVIVPNVTSSSTSHDAHNLRPIRVGKRALLCVSCVAKYLADTLSHLCTYPSSSHSVALPGTPEEPMTNSGLTSARMMTINSSSWCVSLFVKNGMGRRKPRNIVPSRHCRDTRPAVKNYGMRYHDPPPHSRLPTKKSLPLSIALR